MSLTVSHPADGGSFDQHALAVPVQVALQVLLFLGLNAELQVNVVGKLCEIAEAFFSTAHAVAQETWSLSIRMKCIFTTRDDNCNHTRGAQICCQYLLRERESTK